jgi:hypothetical protein
VTTPECCGQDRKQVAESARLIAASDCAPGREQIIYSVRAMGLDGGGLSAASGQRELVRLVAAELSAAWVSDRGSGQPLSGLQGQAEVVQRAAEVSDQHPGERRRGRFGHRPNSADASKCSARLAGHADRERRGLPPVSHSALGTAVMLAWKWLNPYML